MAALPFCELGVPVVLKAGKPKEITIYAGTVGGLLRKRRHELGLTLNQAAAQMDINPWTWGKWERLGSIPICSFYPKIIAFLGYEPWTAPRVFKDHIKAWRLRLGLSSREAAQFIGVDQGTYLRIEHGERRKTSRCLALVHMMLRTGT